MSGRLEINRLNTIKILSHIYSLVQYTLNYQTSQFSYDFIHIYGTEEYILCGYIRDSQPRMLGCGHVKTLKNARLKPAIFWPHEFSVDYKDVQINSVTRSHLFDINNTLFEQNS